MNSQAPGRGVALVEGGRRIGIALPWLAHLWSGGVHRVLDRIDRGLARGSIVVTLPDGTMRLLGGREPGFDAQVTLHGSRALVRLATSGSVGWFQAWDAGEWDSPDPVPLFALFMDNAIELGDSGRSSGPWRLLPRLMHWLNRNSRAGSRRNIHLHYDLGNDFYEAWLGPTMTYSSGLYLPEDGEEQAAAGISALDAAQWAKMAAIDRRIELGDGTRVLEIGCGWGTLAQFLAERHGAHVDAISLSAQQLAYARARRHPSAGGIDFREQDYRDVDGQYDAIVSVEMVEAVGRRFWPRFLDCIARCLKPGGRAALQLITMRDEIFEGYARNPDFIQTYIFPGGMLVRESEFRALAEARGLSWTDPAGFGQDYARTLRDWRAAFDRAVDEGRLPPGFDERFVRLWRYYLMYCEGGFLGGGIDVSQVTLVKRG